MNQLDKIIELLSDNQWHCTSEMAALYMIDYRRRLVDLQRKGYKFENRRCTQHTHPMKEWRLLQLKNNFVEEWLLKYPPKQEVSNQQSLNF